MDDEAAENDGREDSEPVERPWWRRPWGIGSIAAVLAALVAAGVVALVNRGPADDDPVAGRTNPPSAETAAPDQTDEPTPDPSPEETPSQPRRTTDASEPPPDDESDDATPTAPVEESPMDPDEAVREAQRALDEYLAASDAAYQNPNSELGSVSAVAAGVAYSEVQASVAELDDARWRQTGTIEVAEVNPDDVDVKSSPETVKLTACLDTADVDIVDRAGDSVRGPADVGPTRTLHEYRVEHVDDGWLVVDHTQPDDADC